MNFEHILAHHLIDSPISRMFVLGPVAFNLTKHLAMMWIVSAGLIALLTFAARSRAGAARLLRAGIEAVVLYIRDTLLHPIFHGATDTYLPYFLTLFFFILALNLAGLVPYGSAVTANPNVTAALTLCTFGLIHFAGVKEQGPVSYVVHFVPSGLPKFLILPMYVIEGAGLLAKCVSLCIRLFANIIAGHIVSLGFLSTIFIFAEISPYIGLGVAPAAVGLALFVYTLDVLVSLLQAFIFTFLTALFVGGAVHPH